MPYRWLKIAEFINNTAMIDRSFCISLSDPHRGGGKDQTSKLDLKADLFGNKPNRKSWEGVDEVFYDPAECPFHTSFRILPKRVNSSITKAYPGLTRAGTACFDP